MPDTYTTYEAKSRFSEIIRRVRAGRRVIISYRGQPVAEIAPVAQPPATLEQRLDAMRREGILVDGQPAKGRDAAAFRVGPRRPGALKRFLASRD